jgi:hypothetical protein
MSYNKHIKLLLPALLIITLLPVVGNALYIKYSFADLVKRADLVVRGKVIKCESYWGSLPWDINSRIIFTKTTIQITECFKGETGKNEIVIETQGGEIGDVGLKVEDMPRFEPNEDVILFLYPQDSKGIRTVVNFDNGKYTLQQGKVVQNNETVSQFISKIKQAVKETRRGTR